MSEPTISTRQCADLLNQAYGKQVVTRHTMRYEIRIGRLEAVAFGAGGARQRGRIRVTVSAFRAYCETYHPTAVLSHAS